MTQPGAVRTIEIGMMVTVMIANIDRILEALIAAVDVGPRIWLDS
jgi:hypothetical protein